MVKSTRLHFLALACVTLLVPTFRTARADAPVTVTVDASKPGAAIPADFTGLSFEIRLLRGDEAGKRMFNPQNKALIDMFKTVGIRSLRVGGNTTDTPKIPTQVNGATVEIPNPVPQGQDIDELFAFAKAADVKVIYTLRLRGASDPGDAVPIAKYVMDKYKDQVKCLAVGNEPNIFAKEYVDYRKMLGMYIDAIHAPGVAPDAVFCAPSTTPGRAEWVRNIAADTELTTTGKVVLITQHDYPGGNSRKVTDQAAARTTMLSPAWHAIYQKMYDSFVPTVMEHKLSYRIEEANSFYNGGAKDVSDTLASSLWALDYMNWWASHGVQGINFHTGDHVAAGDTLTPCRYAAWWTSEKGYTVHPIAYAIKAFSLSGSGNRIAPTSVESKDGLNLTAYAAVGDKAAYVTIINKEHGADGRAATVTLAPGGAYTHGDTLTLAGPNNDVASTSGVTLGGSQISDDAKWDGKWTATAAPADGKFTIAVPPATAVVVRLTP